MSSFRELLAKAKSEIREIDTATADDLRHLPGTVLLDVREPDEYEQGALPGACTSPVATSSRRSKARSPGTTRRSSSTAQAAFVPHSRRRRSASSATPTWSRLPAASGAGRTKVASGPVPTQLNPDQKIRYHRHLLLPEVGVEGQSKLLESKVLLLGAGGLGSPAALYLAAAGVGTLGIVDMDVVDESNLQRQILHNMDRIGDRKVDSAKKTLTALNPDVERRRVRHAPRCRQRARHHRRLRRDHRRRRQLPVAVSAERRVVEEEDPRRARLDLPLRGPGDGLQPVRRPVLPVHGARAPPAELAPSCAEAGVLGVLPGIIGSIQALEAIKLILGLGDSLAGRLLAYDALEQSFRTYKVLRDPECPACSLDPADIVIAEYDELCMPHRAH